MITILTPTVTAAVTILPPPTWSQRLEGVRSWYWKAVRDHDGFLGVGSVGSFPVKTQAFST